LLEDLHRPIHRTLIAMARSRLSRAIFPAQQQHVHSSSIVGLGNIQPALARRSNGTIVAFVRDVGLAPGRVQVSESHDGGETWSVARDTDLLNPGSSLAVVDLADGRWLLVCNDTESGRHQLAVLVSTTKAGPGIGSSIWTRPNLAQPNTTIRP